MRVVSNRLIDNKAIGDELRYNLVGVNITNLANLARVELGYILAAAKYF